MVILKARVSFGLVVLAGLIGAKRSFQAVYRSFKDWIAAPFSTRMKIHRANNFHPNAWTRLSDLDFKHVLW